MSGSRLPEILVCTGGIGSGKTFVANIFEHMGVPVYYSDLKVKELYLKDKKLVNNIIELFGDNIVLTPDNTTPDNDIPRLDFKKMADIIFKDHSFKDRLESLVFPAVLDDFYEWRRSYSGKAEYVILESAILLEKPIFDELKRKVMVVIAPEEIRIRRVLARDKTTVERVKERIAAQWSDERRKEMSDFVIFADEKRPLLDQIIGIDKQMKKIESL